MEGRVSALVICLLILAGGLGGCTIPAPASLAVPWMIGIERMANDAPPLLPFTNRFLADLAAMPNTQVVYLGAPENAFLFNAWRGNRLRVAPWLRSEGGLRSERTCMSMTYWITQAGQSQDTFGLVVPKLPAGSEPDSACVDRAASDFYAALVVQGL
jgi:hypothetical protein